MGKIQILDAALTALIAAGEVVEGPASVVKELVENSLDANAHNITINIESGGQALVSVTDDGSGMDEEDIAMALKRHATSKINSQRDLTAINTLGFRGEALPSIAAVSKFSITSRLATSLAGAELRGEGGKIQSISPAGCPVGSFIVIKELFYNTPARKKFLKSNRHDSLQVYNLICRLALSRPDVRFKLVDDGQLKLLSPGSGKLLDAIAAVFGVDLARTLVPVKASDSKITISGFISKPYFCKNSRKYQAFFANQRFVENKIFGQAVADAFYKHIPQGKIPAAIISLQIEPSSIDVNVHPSKSLVSFEDEKIIYDLISEGIRNALDYKNTIPYLENNSAILVKSLKVEEEILDNYKPMELDIKIPVPENIKQELPDLTEIPLTGKQFPALSYIAQAGAMYLLALSEEGIYIVDQHAAHERIWYERIKASAKEGNVASQFLAVPQTISLTQQQVDVALKNILSLRSCGFVLEYFGTRSFLLRAVPQGFAAGSESALFLELLDVLETEYIRKDDPKESIIKKLSCTKAVKAGEQLSPNSAQTLLDDLSKCSNPFTCPHGRPTLIGLTFHELTKRFKRTADKA